MLPARSRPYMPYRTNLYNRSFFLLMVILLLSVTPCQAFQSATHRYIAEQAISLLTTTYNIGTEYLESSTYQTITKWAVDADAYNWNNTLKTWTYESDLAPRFHFWDADNNTGLFGFRTAEERARNYWGYAVDEYKAGNKGRAYEFLGATIHFLSDMGSPAHVHNDDHLLTDFLENYAEQNHHWQGVGNRIPAYPNITGYMYNLNQRSAWFPSNGPSQNGVDGNDIDEYGNHHPEWQIGPHYTQADYNLDIFQDVRRTIASTAIPLTIEHVTGMLKLYWDEFHPAIQGTTYPGLVDRPQYSVSGTLDGQTITSCEWDFDYEEGNFTPDASGLTVNAYLFHSWGPRTIAIRVNGSTEIAAKKQINVQPYPITVTYPDGYEDLHRHFSTPTHPDIQSGSYIWNFGDGVVKAGEENSTSHTYATSGFYTVNLTITLSDGAVVTNPQDIFVGPGTRYIPGHTVYVSETWHSGETYAVQGDITVANGATLTIEPGTQVLVAGGVQFTAQGTLKATGVKFTWADGQNQWNGIWFSGTGANGSRLENCTIEHAGGFRYGYDTKGIIFIFSSSPTITGCTISNCTANIGIELYGGSTTTPVISNNTISGMGSYGLNVRENTSPTVTGNTFNGNWYGVYVNYYANTPIFSGNSYASNSQCDLYATGTITNTVAWNETGDAIYRTGWLGIGAGASLTIAPGRTLQFDSGGQLAVSGTLKATGVKFTWADGQNQWGGIIFSGTGASGSRLENCTIEHAVGFRYGYDTKGIIFIDSSSPTITGCTISNCTANTGIELYGDSTTTPVISNNTISGMGSYGLNVRENTSPTVTGNTFNGNWYGVYVNYYANTPIFSGNSYASNSQCDLYATGTITNTVAWNETGDAIYRTGWLGIGAGASLTIAPGRTLQFDSGGQLAVSGTLKATGVKFTWADRQNQWGGIIFSGTGASGSRLENCTIEHAGGVRYGYDTKGIIFIDSSSPTITGCTISNCTANTGIELYGDSTTTPVISNNAISGMGSYGLNVRENTSPTVTGNTFNDNRYGVYYSGSTTLDARNNNWGSPSGPLDASDDRSSGGWYNPNGTGDRVSDRVMYDPWLGKPLTVTLTVAGSGKGTVTSDPAGIAANVSTTSTAFGYGDNLLLTARADEYHLFSGWSGGCANKTGDCAMTLTGDLSVTATFEKDTLHAARLNRPTPVYYSTLLEAYQNAASGDTIQSWATTYEESLTLDKNKNVKFSGGYDQGYTAVKGKTGVKGRLTLGNGVTVLENIELR